jgi:peptide/nickel transport system permease protein
MLAADGRSYMFGAPWMLWAPTIALGIVIFAVNMFGDAVRDLLDPRMRGTG